MKPSTPKPCLAALLAGLGLLAAPLAAVAALDADRLRDLGVQTEVAGRPGVVDEKRFVILQNSRNLYRLEYEANTGAPVRLAPEKVVEGIRKTYADYVTLPTSEKYTGGYPPLGLAPAGNWDDVGFFNLFVNDVGFTYTEPAISTSNLPQQAGVQAVWSNSQATVLQQVVLRENDDKVLMKLQVVPQPGKTVTRLVLRLKNVPALGATAYGIPATRSNAIATAGGEFTAGTRVALTPATRHWVTYYNKDLGYSPSGLRFVPDEVAEGHVLVGADEIHTVLELSPARQTFHFELWEMPKLPNGHLTQYLQQADSSLGGELSALAAQTDWFQALPAVPGQAPLHLPATLRVPTQAEVDRGWLVGQQDAFEYADANTLPTETMPGLSLWGSPGQAVHGAFCLYGLSEATNVTLVMTNLICGAATIPAAQGDLRVVKVWLQKRDYIWGGANAEYIKCPELLVKNDRIALPAVNPDGGTGTPGLITGPVLLDLKRDQAKSCLLTVEVPATAASGVYTGCLQVASPLGSSTIPVSLDVLPIELLGIDNRYDIGIFYRGIVTTAYPTVTLSTAERITPERFAGDLAALRKVGFNTVSLYMNGTNRYHEAYLDTVFPTIDALGFKGPVPILNWGYAYNGNTDEATSAAHRQTVTNFLAYSLARQYPRPVFYGIDEPAGAAEIELCRMRAEITRDAVVNGVRGATMTAGVLTDNTLLDALDYPVMSSYYMSRTLMQSACERSLANGFHPYYYWQCWSEYPKGTRLNSGYFLYASGFQGVMPYAYQHYLDNPYDEYAASMKSMTLLYPSVDGPVATLQSEAMRAGLADLRYLVTLDDRLDAVNRRLGPERTESIRATLSGLLAKYGYTGSQYWGKMIYGALTWPDHQTTVPNAQFDLDRRQIADLILQCLPLLQGTERTFTNHNASMSVAGSWAPAGVPGTNEPGIIGGATPIQANFTANFPVPPGALVVRTNGTLSLQASMTAAHNLVLEGGTLTGAGNRTCGSTISLRNESRFLGPDANNTLTITGLVQDAGAGSDAGRLIVISTNPGSSVVMSGLSNTYSGGTLVKEGLLTVGAEKALGKGRVTVTNGAELRLYALASATWPGGVVEVLSNATVRLQNVSTSGSTTNVVVRNGGRIKGSHVAGNAASYDRVRLEGRALLHRYEWGGGGNTWAGSFRDGAVPGRLVYTGAGTGRTEIAGVNLYTGGTEIEDGGPLAYPLKLTGAGRMPDAGLILIHTNGVMDFNSINDTVGGLAGVGQVWLGTGTVTVAEGLSPGTNDAVSGLLSVTGATGGLVLDAASVSSFQVRSPGTQDQVVLQGTVGLTLAGTIRIAGAPTAGSGAYTLFDLKGGALRGTMPALVLPEDCSGSVATNSGDVVLSLVRHRTFTHDKQSMSEAGHWDPAGVPGANETGIIGGGPPIQAVFTANLAGPPGAIVVRTNGTLSLQADMTAEHNIRMEGGTLTGVGNRVCGSTVWLHNEFRIRGPESSGLALTLSGPVKEADAEPGCLIVTGSESGGPVILGGAASNAYSGGTVIEAGTLRLSGAGRLPEAGPLRIHAPGVMDFNSIPSTVGALAGEGIVMLGTAAVTVKGGVSPGASEAGAGVLTVTGATGRLVLDAAGTNLFHLGTPGVHDQVVMRGAVGLALGGVLQIAGAPALSAGTYTLFDLNGGALSGALPTLRLPETFTGALTTNSGDVVLDVFQQRTFTNDNQSMSVAGNWDPAGVPGTNETGIIGGGPPIQAVFTANLPGPPSAILVRTNGTLSLGASMTTEHHIVMEGGTLTAAANWTFGNTTISLRNESCFLTSDRLTVTGLLQDAGAEAGRLIVTNASAGLTGYLTLGALNSTYSGGTVVHAGTLKITKTDTLGVGPTELRPGSILEWAASTAQRSKIQVLGGKHKVTSNFNLTCTNSVKGDMEVETGAAAAAALAGGIEDYSMSETGRLVKTGSGLLNLNTSNSTYSGGTLVREGILVVRLNERALGKGNVTVTNGAELRLYETYEPTWPGGEVEVLSNATVRLRGTSPAMYSTNVVVRHGGIIRGSDVVGTYYARDRVRIEGRVFLYRNNGAFSVDRGFGAFRDGALPGRLVLTGTGTGNTDIAAAQLYTGGTEIEDGGAQAYPLKLGAGGLMPDTGEILIHTNGVMDFNNISDTVGGLAGVGKIILGKGVVTVNEGVSPGTNSATTGTLTVNGTNAAARIVLGSASTNLFHLRAPGNSDQVIVQGLAGLTLAGTIKIADAPVPASGTYTLFDLNGGALLGTIPLLILPDPCRGSVTTNSGDVALVLRAPQRGSLLVIR